MFSDYSEVQSVIRVYSIRDDCMRALDGCIRELDGHMGVLDGHGHVLDGSDCSDGYGELNIPSHSDLRRRKSLLHIYVLAFRK